MQKENNEKFISVDTLKSMYVGFMYTSKEFKFFNYKNELVESIDNAYIYSLNEMEDFIKSDDELNEDEHQEDVHIINCCDNKENFHFSRDTVYFINLYLLANSHFNYIKYF